MFSISHAYLLLSHVLNAQTLYHQVSRKHTFPKLVCTNVAAGATACRPDDTLPKGCFKAHVQLQALNGRWIKCLSVSDCALHMWQGGDKGGARHPY